MDAHTDSTTLIYINYFPKQVDMKLVQIFLNHILYIEVKTVTEPITCALHSPEMVLIQSLIKARKPTHMEVTASYMGLKMSYGEEEQF